MSLIKINELNTKDTKELFIFVSKKIIESKDQLTKADQAIGDGDHGIGMARGFEAVLTMLESSDFDTLGGLFKAIGKKLLMSIGGAAGAIFGSFFLGAGDNLQYDAIFTSEQLSYMLKDGLLAVLNRGKAQEGDKTMVDALFPAATKSSELINRPLNQALFEVSEAARKGMEATKTMIATVGKAKTLGERSLGHPDPGAISVYLILECMSEFLNNKKE